MQTSALSNTWSRLNLARAPLFGHMLHSHWPQFVARAGTLADLLFTILTEFFGSPVSTPVIGSMTLNPGETTPLSMSFSIHAGMDGPHDFRVHLVSNNPIPARPGADGAF